MVTIVTMRARLSLAVDLVMTCYQALWTVSGSVEFVKKDSYALGLPFLSTKDNMVIRKTTPDSWGVLIKPKLLVVKATEHTSSPYNTCRGVFKRHRLERSQWSKGVSSKRRQHFGCQSLILLRLNRSFLLKKIYRHTHDQSKSSTKPISWSMLTKGSKFTLSIVYFLYTRAYINGGKIENASTESMPFRVNPDGWDIPSLPWVNPTKCFITHVLR